jgi:hypothetical protein
VDKTSIAASIQLRYPTSMRLHSTSAPACVLEIRPRGPGSRGGVLPHWSRTANLPVMRELSLTLGCNSSG